MIYQHEALGKLLVSGWGPFEETGFWSINPNPIMILAIDSAHKIVQVQFICEPYLFAEQVKSQPIQLFCNGLLVVSDVVKQKQVLYFELNTEGKELSRIKLNFILPNAAVPFKLDDGQDRRMLGIKINELALL
jgi:hypothetical protein